MKKKIIFILTLILLVVVFSTLFFIKFYKVNKIIDLMKVNSNKQNYSYFEKDYVEKINISFIKRAKDIILHRDLTINKNILNYYNFYEKETYIFDEDNNSYLLRKILYTEESFFKFPFYNYLTSDFSFKNKLRLVFDWKIEDIENNCYEITTKENYKITFDKNTGIILRVRSLNPKTKFDKGIEDFKENSVTEEDVKLPDLTEYTQVK